MVYHKESGSIEVSELLLSQAFEAIASRDAAAVSTIDVPPAMVEGVIEYLSEDLGCDHAVNICTCGTSGLVSELKLALEGKRSCPSCNGDQYVWDQEAYERNSKKYAEGNKMSLEEAQRSYGDEFGYVDCSVCNATGAVLL